MSKQWEVLKVDDDYEININYPYHIRRKRQRRIIKINIPEKGYPRVILNSHPYTLHRVIAKQWIPNPLKLRYVDHRDRNPGNWHIENLRWITSSGNGMNKTSANGVKQLYVDELPKGAVQVKKYGEKGHDFTNLNLYFYDNVFYIKTDENQYKLRRLHNDPRNNFFVMIQIGVFKSKPVYYSRFKRENNLEHIPPPFQEWEWQQRRFNKAKVRRTIIHKYFCKKYRGRLKKKWKY